MIALIAAAAAMVAVLASIAASNKLRAARLWLWAGLLAPVSVGLNRTAEQVEFSTANSAADALRIGVPVVALALGTALARPVRSGHGAAVAFLALFVAWCAASAFWSVNGFATVVKAATLGVEFSLALALARRYPDGPTMLRAISGAAQLLMVSVAAGLVIFPGLAFAELADGTRRLVGVWPAIHPNVMGMVALVALVALATNVSPRWAQRPSVRLILAVIAVSDLLMARTRLAFALVVLVLVFAALRAMRQRASAAVTLAAASGCAIAFVQLYWGTIHAFLLRGQTDAQLASLTGRLPLWQNALRVWEDDPLIGFGYFSGHRYAVPPVPGSGVSSNVDNMWVELLVDVGIVGALLMAGAVAFGAARLISRQSEPRYRTFAIATAGAFALATVFNPSLQLVALIGTFFALLLVAEQPDRKGGRAARTGAQRREVRGESLTTLR